MAQTNTVQPNRWVDKLATHYGLTVQRVTACPSWYRPAAAYRLDTTEGAFAVKPFLGSAARLKALYAATEPFRDLLHAPFAQWKLTLKNKPFVQIRKQCFYVTQWVDGAALKDDLDDIRSLGTLLGHVHARTENIASSGEIIHDEWRMLVDRDHKFRARTPAVLFGYGAISHWLRHHYKHCEALADEAWSMMGRAQADGSMNHGWDETWVHGDVTRPNVVVTHDRDVVLIDWDQLHIGSSMYELAKTLANTTDFDTKAMRALLTGYESVRPIPAAYRTILAALFRLPREAWYLVDAVVGGRTPAVFAPLTSSWSERLKAVRFVDNWASSKRGSRRSHDSKGQHHRTRAQ